MKRSILMAVAGFGLSVLVAGSGSALAGGNDPQGHWTWQEQEALMTGALPGSDAAKTADEPVSLRDPRGFSDTLEYWAWQHDEAIETGHLVVSGDAPDFDSDARWQESGGE